MEGEERMMCDGEEFDRLVAKAEAYDRLIGELDTMAEYTRAIYGLETASKIIREVESNPEVSDERSRELLAGIEDRLGALWVHLLAMKHEVRKQFWNQEEVEG
jgi:hypothetical protein